MCIQAKAEYTKKEGMMEMKKVDKKNIRIALCLLLAFVLWTVAVCCVDIQAVGPQGSVVGFSTFNVFVHELTGVNMTLYTVTDWLGLVPLMLVLVFAVLGLVQWIRRGHLLKVDYSILALGVFYIIVLGLFVFFETFVVNYRPVLIEGRLEASYPSSTTMLVMCVMPTAIMQLGYRVKSTALRRIFTLAIVTFTLFMVIGRLVSGVHWCSDIIGGALFSAGLVMTYYSVVNIGLKR